MNHAPNRRSRRSGIAVVATVFILASLLGSVADAAAKPVRHFRASLTPSCVLAGMRQTLVGTISNDTTSNQPLGSAFFDTTLTAFSHIDGTPPFVVTASNSAKHWTALREDAFGTSGDRRDLDGIFLKANSTADVLSPGESVTVTFQATVGSTTGSKAWTVSAWQSTTPFGSGAFSNVGGSVSVQVASSCPGTHLAFLQQPTDANATAAISPSVTVQVLDAANNPAPGASNAITLAIGTNAGSGTLSGTKTVNASGGVATFSDLSIDKVGTGYTLTASATGLTGVTSNGFNITTGDAASIAFVAGPSDTEAGGTMADVAVKVTDAGGNPVSGESVTLDSTGLASTPSGSQPTGLDGVATFSGPDLSVTTPAGPYTKTASDAAASLTTDPADFSVTAGSPAISFTKQPTDTLVNQAIAGQGGGGVEVTLEDTFGNPVPDGTSVAMSLGVDPTGVAILGGTLTETTSSGVATFSDLTIDTTSSGYQLQATSGSLQVDSDVFAITNTDGSCTTDCTATFPNGTSTVSAPAGTTLIIETNQLDCSGVETPIAGTVTIIPADPNTTAGVPIVFDDTIGFPIQGFFPFCKTPNTTETVPSCDNLPAGEGLNESGGTVACVEETIVLHGSNPPTLHSVLWIDGSDPIGKH